MQIELRAFVSSTLGNKLHTENTLGRPVLFLLNINLVFHFTRIDLEIPLGAIGIKNELDGCLLITNSLSQK